QNQHPAGTPPARTLSIYKDPQTGERVFEVQEQAGNVGPTAPRAEPTHVERVQASYNAKIRAHDEAIQRLAKEYSAVADVKVVRNPDGSVKIDANGNPVTKPVYVANPERRAWIEKEIAQRRRDQEYLTIRHMQELGEAT